MSRDSSPSAFILPAKRRIILSPWLLMKLLGQRYVLACYRYIELNPVRANMVTHPISPGPTRFCLVLGTDPVHLQYEAREAFDRRQAADLGIKLAARTKV